MRNFIDILEARDAIFGIGLWVSPKGEILSVDGDHTEFMEEHPELVAKGDYVDAGIAAVMQGWVRVVVKPNIVWISAQNLEGVKRTLKAIYRAKWTTPDVTLTIDLFDGDDSQSFRVESGRALLSPKS